MIMNIGRVCKMVRGKNAGNYCAVVEKIDRNFVLVEGKGIKGKKVNIMHLEPLPVILEIGKKANTENVVKALDDAGF